MNRAVRRVVVRFGQFAGVLSISLYDRLLAYHRPYRATNLAVAMEVLTILCVSRR